MHWLELPDRFLRVSASLRNEIDAFFTDLHLTWLQLSSADREHYRFSQVTTPAICGFLWAGYRDAASGPRRRVGHIDGQFDVFLEMNRFTLFGEWPPQPIMDLVAELSWFQDLLEWRKAIFEREAGRFMGVFPDVTRRPLAMSPARGAAYPYPVWRRSQCRLVQSLPDEEAARAEGWVPYAERAELIESSKVEQQQPAFGAAVPINSETEKKHQDQTGVAANKKLMVDALSTDSDTERTDVADRGIPPISQQIREQMEKLRLQNSDLVEATKFASRTVERHTTGAREPRKLSTIKAYETAITAARDGEPFTFILPPRKPRRRNQRSHKAAKRR